MPVCLTKGQKISLTKGNPGLKNVVIGLGWDVNQYDTGGDFDLDAAAFLLTEGGRVSRQEDFVFYGNLTHPSESVKHLGDNLTGAGDGDDEQIVVDLANGEELLRYDLGEDFSIETAVVFGELYKNGAEWKFNAVGNGFQGGLAALCANYGVEVE